MLDIKFVRENPEIVKENIRKKFQDEKLPLVDAVIALDRENRDIKGELQALLADRNRISKSIGMLMAKGQREEAEVRDYGEGDNRRHCVHLHGNAGIRGPA